MSAFIKQPWVVEAEIFVDDAEGKTVCVPMADMPQGRIDRARLIAATPDLMEALLFVKKEWQHAAPTDCYSRGPCTGDLIQDHIACPGCEVQRVIDAAIAKAVSA